MKMDNSGALLVIGHCEVIRSDLDGATVSAGSFNSRVGHAVRNGHHIATSSCRPPRRSQRCRLRRQIHRVGVRRPYDQSMEHRDERIYTNAERTQTRHCVSTVPRPSRRFRQLR